MSPLTHTRDAVLLVPWELPTSTTITTTSENTFDSGQFRPKSLGPENQEDVLKFVLKVQKETLVPSDTGCG